jgi:acyl-CoA thioester hydrolase
MNTSLAPASGILRGKTHVLPVRIYFADTDAFGVVYHSRYLDFAERARTEMLRLLGFVHAQMMTSGDSAGAFVVRRAEMDFRRSAKLDDLLEVRTRLLAVGGATLDAEQIIYRPADDLDLVRMTIHLGCVRLDSRPQRMPAELRSTLQSLVVQED